jgi:signal peptidase I
MTESLNQEPEKENRVQEPQKNPPTHSENIWVETLKTIATAIVLAIGIRTFVAEARYIPSESMVPTLEVNDRLIIEKISYHFHNPQRGDIVVFNPPQTALICYEKNGQDPPPKIKDAYIKRVIGLPGDIVEVKNQKVYVNNQPLTESYIANAPIYDFEPEKVPANSYFVLGDNRNSSCDSHLWGFVPKGNLIGRAVVRFWPLNRIGGLN